MAALCMFIEHRFGDMKNAFKLLGRTKILHIQDSPMHAIFPVFLVFNCRTCLRGSGRMYFDVQPPTLEEYLPLDQEFPPAPEVTVPDNYVHGDVNN